ncbi:hypothetical protein Fmac_015475 [Flemingia macrophylla]|uniref:Uncharacterized protein n=1 Tax=Flemingia macrophylla TaxID=520843 RepID=A0ABD1MF95_9FABA
MISLSFPNLPQLQQINVTQGVPKENESAKRVSSSTVFSNVQRARLRSCNLSDGFFPTVIPWFANVKELDLSSNNFTIIPECIKQCQFLTRLYLDNCERLQEIRGIPPNLKYFSAIKCLSLTASCRSMFLSQELHEAGNTVFYLPGTKIPEWFECQTEGASISFWFRNKFPAIAICLVIGPVGQYSSPEDGYLFRAIVVINGNKHAFLFEDLWMGMDNTCLFDLQEMKLEDDLDEELSENEWNHAEIIYENLSSIPIILQSGIHELKRETSMGLGDILFIDPCKKRKLDDHLNSSESQNPQLQEKRRLMDMEGFESQNVQKQQCISIFSRMWNWARYMV